MPSFVLISGCSSGIGELTAKAAARAGHHVYATMRGSTMRNADAREALDGFAKENGVALRTIEMDVCNTDSVKKAVDRVLVDEGRIHAVVNNAGIMSIGLAEGFTEEQMRESLDVNRRAPGLKVCWWNPGRIHSICFSTAPLRLTCRRVRTAGLAAGTFTAGCGRGDREPDRSTGGTCPLRTVCGMDFGTNGLNRQMAPIQAAVLRGLGMEHMVPAIATKHVRPYTFHGLLITERHYIPPTRQVRVRMVSCDAPIFFDDESNSKHAVLSRSH